MERVQVTVTGAAGQIAYSLLFRLASGEVFGDNVQVDLKLLEIPEAVKGAEGVAMELDDCAFPTLGTVDCFSEATKAFADTDWALMIGSSPRLKGMARSDLLLANGPIFVEQGKALLKASSKVMVCVVGNPCNTNALIALKNAQDIPKERFSAMTALDENRAKIQIAKKLKVNVKDIEALTIWGNHSSTMFPDFENAKVKGQRIIDIFPERAWYEQQFMPTVQERGAAIIEARGKSSAGSAASALIDHVQNLSGGRGKASFSAAVYSDLGTSYGLPKDTICSMPLLAQGSGKYKLVEGIELSSYAKAKIEASCKELIAEKEMVKDFLKS